jgi:hypothetical protein
MGVLNWKINSTGRNKQKQIVDFSRSLTGGISACAYNSSALL